MINTYVLCWIRPGTLCWQCVNLTAILETLKWKDFFFFSLDKEFNNQFQQLQGIELVTQSCDL